MAPLTKKAIILTAIVVLVAASAFIGGILGFMQGYNYGTGDTGARAVGVAITLHSLRSGNVPKGISRLESALDSFIIEHWATGFSVFPWITRTMRDDAVDRKLFAYVARYRTEHPSLAEDPEIRSTISSHLKRFQPQ